MKNSFIPKNYRPVVPGSKLHYHQSDVKKIVFSTAPLKKCIVILSAKEDIVPDYFLEDINNKKLITHLYYDDLGILWDFSYTDSDLKIYIQDKILHPYSIYHRHPGVSHDHPFYSKHISFFEILDIWDGNLLGQRRDHYQNFSKAYQGITSIKKSNLKTGQNIKYPRSFFVKGNYNKLSTKFKKPLIVKSCSNTRSMVVSTEVFSTWNYNNLNNLPTFFQEKIDGVDTRVHVCDKTVWALEVLNKDCIDYRYASKGSVKYKKIDLPQSVISFCQAIAKTEKNRFIGIDLMRSGDSYYCLESNPGPGWSTYCHPTKKKFAQSILKQLLRS